MNKINWREVILTIKRERKWPMKTISGKAGVSRNSLYRWQNGVNYPRPAHGEVLLRLAGIEG